MTTMGLRYLEHQETKRSNQAREAETNRSNLATESETHRSNLARETETHRSNLINEAETHRSNVARENETIRSNLAKEAETNRANLAKERETNRANVAKETETSRNNRATYDAKVYEAFIKNADAIQKQHIQSAGITPKTLRNYLDYKSQRGETFGGNLEGTAEGLGGFIIRYLDDILTFAK